jgi:hypothetical protein
MDNIIKMTFKNSSLFTFKGTTGGKEVGTIKIGNSEAYESLVEDNEVHEFVNIVELGEDHLAHPDPWTTIVLTEEWAKSFAKAVRKTPKPMFIPGHADGNAGYKGRAIPDGYITGGTVKDNRLYLRNTMILDGARDALIKQTAKEIKAKMLSTSTSDYMKYKTERNEETDELIYFAIESVGGQSNALVEADQTGSDTEIIITSFKTEGGEDGKQGESHMDKDVKKVELTNLEMFTVLKNQLDSGRLALAEVATSLGIEVMTPKQKTALKRLNDVESKVGDIVEYVKQTVEVREESFKSLKESKIKDKFKSEELIEIATPLFALKEGSVEQIDTEVNRIAELKVFKSIQGTKAGIINFSLGGVSDEITDEESEDMEA